MSEFELEQKCAELKKYQGYTNYETWVTALWLGNDFETDSELHRKAEERAEQAKEDENVKNGIWTECEAAKLRLADDIQKMIEDGNPLVDASLYTDILTANLQEVDWQEIAAGYLEDKGNPCPSRRK